LKDLVPLPALDKTLKVPKFSFIDTPIGTVPTKLHVEDISDE
jgi:hypothetical protein